MGGAVGADALVLFGTAIFAVAGGVAALGAGRDAFSFIGAAFLHAGNAAFLAVGSFLSAGGGAGAGCTGSGAATDGFLTADLLDTCSTQLHPKVWYHCTFAGSRAHLRSTSIHSHLAGGNRGRSGWPLSSANNFHQTRAKLNREEQARKQAEPAAHPWSQQRQNPKYTPTGEAAWLEW